MKIKAVAALLAPIALLAGCAAPGSSDAPSDGKLKVAAAFYPLQYAAEQAGGNAVTVTNLTTPGVEAHDLELSPKQIVELAKADVVVYLKGFQPAVDAAIAQAEPKKVIEVSQFAQQASEKHDHKHADGHDHKHEDGHVCSHGHKHDHGATDPHFWLDPTRLAKVSAAIAEELGKISPKSKATFTANAQRTTTALNTLDQEFKTGLASCKRKEFVVSHAAFGYLASRYGLKQIAISGLSPNAEPSPARIAEVQKLAKQHGITTIFFETLSSPAVAKSIAGDLGLKTGVLNPVEGLTQDAAGQDYPSIMRSNLKALQAANSCG